MCVCVCACTNEVLHVQSEYFLDVLPNVWLPDPSDLYST